jgi:hypothetical protein
MSRIMQLGRTGIGWRAGALFCAVAIALATLPRWPRFNRHSQRMLSLIPPQPSSKPASPHSTTAGSGLRSGSPMQPNKK